MPKITAPTVAEHRTQKRTALIRAGEALLLDGGLAAVSPRTVTERADLSRSSFYDYFPSKDDLLVAIAIDAIERWDAEIAEAMAGAEPGEAGLRVFIDTTMSMAADGRHDIAGLLRDANLQPSRFDDLMALHDALMLPLIRVLSDLRVTPSRSTIALAEGMLGAGIKLIGHGVDHRKVADDAYRLLSRGLLG